jgi:hypothetical protein
MQDSEKGGGAPPAESQSDTAEAERRSPRTPPAPPEPPWTKPAEDSERLPPESVGSVEGLPGVGRTGPGIREKDQASAKAESRRCRGGRRMGKGRA